MRNIFIATTFSFALVSCLKLSGPVIDNVPDSFLSGPGVFIINEGNFRAGNGSISFYSYDSSKIYNHVFYSVNQRPLGDVPYSMNIKDNTAYIVVNNSGKIELTDVDHLQSVSTINGLTAPRYISFVTDSKAYVTSLYSDSVTVLNLLSNTIFGYINLKHSSEAIAANYGEAFVANWTGGNKIFVININNDMVTDSVEVGIEPESMVIDMNGTLWVLCNGGWQREYFAELIAINTLDHKIVKRFTFPLKTDSPTSLQIDGSGETLYYLDNGVKKMSINASNLPGETFIPKLDRNFYKLGVNPVGGDIFVTDALDYQNKGYVLRYNQNGGLISMQQADIIPGGMLR